MNARLIIPFLKQPLLWLYCLIGLVLSAIVFWIDFSHIKRAPDIVAFRQLTVFAIGTGGILLMLLSEHHQLKAAPLIPRLRATFTRSYILWALLAASLLATAHTALFGTISWWPLSTYVCLLITLPSLCVGAVHTRLQFMLQVATFSCLPYAFVIFAHLIIEPLQKHPLICTSLSLGISLYLSTRFWRIAIWREGSLAPIGISFLIARMDPDQRRLWHSFLFSAKSSPRFATPINRSRFAQLCALSWYQTKQMRRPLMLTINALSYVGIAFTPLKESGGLSELLLGKLSPTGAYTIALTASLPEFFASCITISICALLFNSNGNVLPMGRELRAQIAFRLCLRYTLTLCAFFTGVKVVLYVLSLFLAAAPTHSTPTIPWFIHSILWGAALVPMLQLSMLQAAKQPSLKALGLILACLLATLSLKFIVAALPAWSLAPLLIAIVIGTHALLRSQIHRHFTQADLIAPLH